MCKIFVSVLEVHILHILHGTNSARPRLIYLKGENSALRPHYLKAHY